MGNYIGTLTRQTLDSTGIVNKSHVFFSVMVFKGEPAVKLHAKNVKVGTSVNWNPRYDQITMGRVDSPGTTHD